MHPKIKQALIDQMEKLTLSSRAIHSNLLGPASQKLTQLFDFDQMIYGNTGVEAGETAVKIARKWAYEVKGVKEDCARVVYASNNFWGRTIAACGSSDDPSRYKNFGPFKGLNFDIIEYNDIQAFKDYLEIHGENLAAYFVEPIQGEGGVKIPDPDYFQKVKELCEQYNVLLVLDEVQTGLGRTGKLFAHHYDGIKPDMLCLGKSMSGGFFPISAVFGSHAVMNCLRLGDHGSTFAASPLACAVSTKAVDVIFEEKMIENSLQKGEYIMNELKNQKRSYIKDIRGRGLMIGLE